MPPTADAAIVSCSYFPSSRQASETRQPRHINVGWLLKLPVSQAALHACSSPRPVEHAPRQPQVSLLARASSSRAPSQGHRPQWHTARSSALTVVVYSPGFAPGSLLPPADKARRPRLRDIDACYFTPLPTGHVPASSETAAPIAVHVAPDLPTGTIPASCAITRALTAYAWFSGRCPR